MSWTGVIPKAAKSVVSWGGKHLPQILTGCGIASATAASIFCARASFKSMQDLNELLADLIRTGELPPDATLDDLTFAEKADEIWINYIPTGLMLILSAGCGIAAQVVNGQKQAALAAAYSLADTTLREYQQSVINAVGPQKEAEIRQQAVESRIRRLEDHPSQVIFTGKGNHLCLEEGTNQIFYSDYDRVRHEILNINERINDEMYVSYNDLLSELGCKTVSYGDRCGFNSHIDAKYTSILYTDEALGLYNVPCMVLSYYIEPREDFRNLH